jgi:hypothetical protein
MLSHIHNCDRFIFVFLIALFLAFNSSKSLAQGTSLTYQGKLGDGRTPPRGIYSFRFKLFDERNFSL